MLRKLPVALAGAATLLALCAVAIAPNANAARPQNPPSPEGGPERGREPSAEARRRWQELDPAERERLRQRYEEFQKLAPDRRAEIEERLGRLQRLRQEAEERVPPELKAKLEKLSPEERREVLRDYFLTEFQNRGERIREKLPEEWRQRLENAGPEEREELLHQLREQRRQSEAPGAIEHLGRSLQLPREEVERLKGLPPEEQIRAIEDLRRSELQRGGPPPGLSPEEWQRWRELPAPDLMERWHRHDSWRGHGGPARGQWPGRDRSAPDGPRPDREGRPEWGPKPDRPDSSGRPGGPGGELPPPPEGMDRPGGVRAPGQLSPSAARELHRALRPDSQWVIEFAELPSEERRARISERCRERALTALENLPEVDPSTLERLRALQGREFFEALRPLVGGFSPRRGFGGHHEPHPPRGTDCQAPAPDGRAPDGRAPDGRAPDGRDGRPSDPI
jgi:hypothetical protein